MISLIFHVEERLKMFGHKKKQQTSVFTVNQSHNLLYYDLGRLLFERGFYCNFSNLKPGFYSREASIQAGTVTVFTLCTE